MGRCLPHLPLYVWDDWVFCLCGVAGRVHDGTGGDTCAENGTANWADRAHNTNALLV